MRMAQEETVAILAGGIGAGIGMGIARIVPVDGVIALLVAAVGGAVLALLFFYLLKSSGF